MKPRIVFNTVKESDSSLAGALSTPGMVSHGGDTVKRDFKQKINQEAFAAPYSFDEEEKKEEPSTAKIMKESTSIWSNYKVPRDNSPTRSLSGFSDTPTSEMTAKKKTSGQQKNFQHFLGYMQPSALKRGSVPNAPVIEKPAGRIQSPFNRGEMIRQAVINQDIMQRDRQCSVATCITMANINEVERPPNMLGQFKIDEEDKDQNSNMPGFLTPRDEEIDKEELHQPEEQSLDTPGSYSRSNFNQIFALKEPTNSRHLSPSTAGRKESGQVPRTLSGFSMSVKQSQQPEIEEEDASDHGINMFKQKYPLLGAEREKKRRSLKHDEASGNEGDSEVRKAMSKEGSKRSSGSMFRSSYRFINQKNQNNELKVPPQQDNLPTVSSQQRLSPAPDSEVYSFKPKCKNLNLGATFSLPKKEWGAQGADEQPRVVSNPQPISLINKGARQSTMNSNTDTPKLYDEGRQQINPALLHENLIQNFHQTRVRSQSIAPGLSYNINQKKLVHTQTNDDLPPNELTPPGIKPPKQDSSEALKPEEKPGFFLKIGQKFSQLKDKMKSSFGKGDKALKYEPQNQNDETSLQVNNLFEEERKEKLERLEKGKSLIAEFIKKRRERDMKSSPHDNDPQSSSSLNKQGLIMPKSKKLPFTQRLKRKIYDNILKDHQSKVSEHLNIKHESEEEGETILQKLDRDLASVIKPQQHNVIQQNHPVKLGWDLFIMFVATYFAFVVPMELAFGEDFWNPTMLTYVGLLADTIFIFDILINFRTSYFNQSTGEEVFEPKHIAKNYVSSFRFWVDIMSAIPFDTIVGWFIQNQSSAAQFKVTSMIKLLRIFRISNMITYMNTTEDIKQLLKLAKLLFFLLIYIHVSACLIYLVSDSDREWVPTTYQYYMITDFYFDASLRTRYLLVFYNSILTLTGNEINPRNDMHVFATSVMLITGSLIIANIFGNIAVIVSSMNRKAQRFQEQIDVANTSMRNMKLPEGLQANVRRFMMSTQNNLDNQKELDQFMSMISPSLRNQVTKHIFLDGLSKNPILGGVNDMVDFLINDVSTLLYLPEDTIISQGQQGDSLFLIATGDCIVWVKDHRKCSIFVQQLFQGEYFGEIALITSSARTASVKSSNYCTLISINKVVFYNLCSSYPDILLKMKQQTMKYKDPWKRLKLHMLRSIDYFSALLDDDEFFDEIHYHMQEENFEAGLNIVQAGEKCTSVIFVVEGIIELVVFDQQGQEIPIETLTQGDIIGQYSVIFNEGFLFTAIARTNVRILSLSSDFFIKKIDQIEGLEDAVLEAEEFVEENGLPICDFKVSAEGFSQADKFKRGVLRAIQLNKLQKASPLRTKKKKVGAVAKFSSKYAGFPVFQYSNRTHKSPLPHFTASSKSLFFNNFREERRRRSILAGARKEIGAMENLAPPQRSPYGMRPNLSKLHRKLTHQASGIIRKRRQSRMAKAALRSSEFSASFVNKSLTSTVSLLSNLKQFPNNEVTTPEARQRIPPKNKLISMKKKTSNSFKLQKPSNTQSLHFVDHLSGTSGMNQKSQDQLSNFGGSQLIADNIKDTSMMNKELTDLSENSQEDEDKSGGKKRETSYFNHHHHKPQHDHKHDRQQHDHGHRNMHHDRGPNEHGHHAHIEAKPQASQFPPISGLSRIPTSTENSELAVPQRRNISIISSIKEKHSEQQRQAIAQKMQSHPKSIVPRKATMDKRQPTPMNDVLSSDSFESASHDLTSSSSDSLSSVSKVTTSRKHKIDDEVLRAFGAGPIGNAAVKPPGGGPQQTFMTQKTLKVPNKQPNAQANGSMRSIRDQRRQSRMYALQMAKQFYK